MTEWLKEVADPAVSIAWSTLLIRLILAFIFGVLVIGIYKGTRRSTSVSATFPATLVLLSILIAMVTQVIGENVARAFSLVGALSVVRFRTVVRDTKDTAFVIVAVVVGMATGSGQPIVAICGLIVVGTASFLFRDRSSELLNISRDMLLTLRMVWSLELESKVAKLLKRLTDVSIAVEASTAKQGTVMDLTYHVRVSKGITLPQIITELSVLEGIQSVELRKNKDDA